MFSRFVLIALFLASVGMFFTVIDPTYKENQLLLAEKSKLSEALSKARELQEVSEELEAKASTVSSEDILRLERLLPDNVDNVRLIIDIEQIANRYGLTINNLQLEKKKETGQTEVVERQRGAFARPQIAANEQVGPAKDSPLQSIVLEFSVSSSYKNFLRFLKDLESSLRLVEVVGISFNSAEADFFDFSVRIKTYSLL